MTSKIENGFNKQILKHYLPNVCPTDLRFSYYEQASKCIKTEGVVIDE